MTPASRHAGILAGLALSALIALGLVHRSRTEWTLRYSAETELRTQREAEIGRLQAAHLEELAGMTERVAFLESDLAREKEQREAAEARGAQGAGSISELEASRGELSRAYTRIAELERGTASLELPEIEGRLADLQDGTLGSAKVFRLSVNRKTQVKDAVVSFEVDATTALQDLQRAKLGKIVEVIKQIDLAQPDGLDRPLNQGVDYVAPVEMIEGTEQTEGDDWSNDAAIHSW